MIDLTFSLPSLARYGEARSNSLIFALLGLPRVVAGRMLTKRHTVTLTLSNNAEHTQPQAGARTKT